ncbi:MAG: hypothetical protein AAFP90_13875 [Planctomycetota bacterium]
MNEGIGDPAAPQENPYAPPTTVSESVQRAEDEGNDIPKPRRLGRIVLRWALVCGFSAAPSFFWGLGISNGQALVPMLIVTFFFVCCYSALDYRTHYWPIRRFPPIRWTLMIGYGARIVVSVIFPVAMFLDAYTFLAVMTLFGPNRPAARNFDSFLENCSHTFLQALAMHVVLLTFMGLVLLIYTVVWHGLGHADQYKKRQLAKRQAESKRHDPNQSDAPFAASDSS